MSDPASQPSPTEPCINGHDPLAALRDCGADRFDPIRFRFIEALARRAESHQGDARRMLDEKLARALADYRTRIGEDQGENRHATHPAMAADDPKQAGDAGDISPLRRLLAELEDLGSRDLSPHPGGQMARQAPEIASTSTAAANSGAIPAAPRTELKSLRYFRDTWSKLSVERQLAQALAQGPENAGPLNSHLLVLESLKLMRDVSPDYLSRFVSYVDALLWLDQANDTRMPAAKEAARKEKDNRPKPSRAKAK